MTIKPDPVEALAYAAKKLQSTWNEFGDVTAAIACECIGEYFPSLDAALDAFDASADVRKAEREFLAAAKEQMRFWKDTWDMDCDRGVVVNKDFEDTYDALLAARAALAVEKS